MHSAVPFQMCITRILFRWLHRLVLVQMAPMQLFYRLGMYQRGDQQVLPGIMLQELFHL